MNESSYRVVARAVNCDVETFERIAGTLCRTFRLEVTAVTSQLDADGVVVCEASSYEEARVYAKRVRDMGADSLVLDPSGKVVEQTGSPQKRDRPSQPDPPVDPRTMMGGFGAPDEGDLEIGYQPASPGLPPRVAVPSEELPPLDSMAPGHAPSDGDLLALEGDSSRGASIPAVDDTPAPDLLDGTSPDLPPAASTATLQGTQSPAMFGALDQLDADNLVLLDGSTEERGDAKPMGVEHADAGAAGPSAVAPSSGAPSAAPSANPAGAAAPADAAATDAPGPSASPGPPAEAPLFGGADLGEDAFAPPAEEEALELDTDYHEHAEGVGQAGAEAAAASLAEEEEADDEAEWIPAEDDERGPRLTSARPKRAPPGPSAPAAPLERRATGDHPVPGWRGAVKRSRSPLELPVELFRVYPRLRIVVGFALALGLGAIAPTCYAGSVVDEKIQPLLVDLSTARAHGHLMVGTPGYRSPEQIEESIGSIKTRHGTYAVLMWLAVSGVVGFLWFRFIRPD